jgi:ubiquinone/menaquinone biosynthesis C-methylase UbiE
MSLFLDVLTWVGIVFGIILLWVFVIARIIRRIHPFPIPGILTRVIDNPIRRRFIQSPKELADRMHLTSGMVVVEIGPGKGNYTKAVAEQVAPGKVYACDIQDSVIQRLKQRVEEEKLQNIIPQIEDAYQFSFPDQSVDRVFAIACLPEIPNPVKVLMECRRILKPGGLVCLSELFIDPDYPRRKTEKQWAREAGLELVDEFGNWFAYQLNFQKL